MRFVVLVDKRQRPATPSHPGGGGGMPYYRLDFMDRFSGHIDHFREFEAEDD